MADKKKKVLPEYSIDDTGLLGGLGNLLAGGARPRAALKGLLQGDISPLKNAWGEIQQLGNPEYMSKVNPMTTQEAMDMGLLALTTTGGKLADALPKTKYELAHELAQKNAVEMLGLPANNTAMDRAKALGFDTQAYHGTDKTFEAFDPALADTARKTGTPSGAMVVTSEPKTAATYGMDYAGDFTTTYKDGANVMPLMVNRGKNLSMDATQGGYTPNWNDLYNPKYPEIQSTNDFALMAKSKGKNSATIKNVKDNARSSAAEGDTTFLFNPNQLRSRFAAFDPARAHESDLLGNASPELLAYIAGGGLLGLGAYKYGGDK